MSKILKATHAARYKSMGIPPEIAIAKNGGILKNSRFFKRQVSATSGNDNNIASAVFLGLSRIRAFLLSALRFRKDEMTLPAAPPIATA